MNNEYIEVVNQAKLLWVIITNDLNWDSNTEYVFKKANSRMELHVVYKNYSWTIQCGVAQQPNPR